MNSNGIKMFAEMNGLQFDKKREIAYGVYQGYHTIIHFLKAQKTNMVVMQVNGERLGVESELVNGLNAIASGREFVNYANYIKDTITVSIKNKGNMDSDNLRDVMNAVVSLCRGQGLVSCCGRCGKESGLSVYSIGGRCETMCASCFSTAANGLHQENGDGKGSNMLAGIVGAFLGSLIGVVLWIIVYEIGYIAGIVGIILTVCSLKGYEKFSGKMTKAGVFIAVFVSFAMIFVAEYLAWGIAIYTQELRGYYRQATVFTGIRLVAFVLEDPEAMGSFIMDLIFGYVFWAIGNIATIRQMLHSVSPETEATRLG